MVSVIKALFVLNYYLLIITIEFLLCPWHCEEVHMHCFSQSS